MEGSTDEAALQIEAQPERSTPWPTAPSSTVSSAICSSSSYHIIFSEENEHEDIECYVIKISEDRPPRTLFPLCEWRVQNPYNWTVLGNQLYSVGGWRPVRDLWTLDVTRPLEGWNSGPPMLCPRLESCRTLALDGNLFVFSGCDPSSQHWGEFFDPESLSWNALPDPPSRLDGDLDEMICVAREDSNTILVGSSVSKALNFIFYTYNVVTRRWATLHLERQMNSIVHLQGWKAVAAGNSLYWITHERGKITLLAYNLDRDMWLEGRFDWLLVRGKYWGNGHGFYNSGEHLVHLGNRRFCALVEYKSKSDLDFMYFYRVVIDVGHNFVRKRLNISVVSTQKFKTASGSSINTCHLLRIAHDQSSHVTPSRSTRDMEIQNNDGEESVEEEVIHELSTRMETVKRQLDEIEGGLPRKMDSLKRQLDEIEGGLPRNMDSVKKQLDEIERSLQREIGSVKKSLDEIQRGPRTKDMRKREHGDEMGGCSKFQEGERSDKDEYRHSEKQLDNVNDKEDDGVKNRYENLDDHHSKRRKDEEHLRRDHDDKEEILHGHM